MKIVFIVNSRKNRMAYLKRVEQYCQKVSPGSAQFLLTMRKNHAIQFAKQAAENNCDYLIAVGGDGTLNEVINGVFQSNLPSNLYPTLGLLPCGSGNDFARTARITNSIEELMGLIKSKSIQKTDLGKIILHQTRETRYFINIAGVGLGAEVVQSMVQSKSFFGPAVNYSWHILKGFLDYDKKEVVCNGSDWEWKGRLLQMAIANGRYFGNALCIAPDANLSDGMFQLAIFGDLSIWDYLKNLGRLKKGLKISHQQVHYHITREVTLQSNDPCSIEADGEYVGQLPATIRVLPRAISFLSPSNLP
ncbi:diacylglycerol kinase family protein [Robiginitalea sp. SC105]|uniref:diacylglycerol/lipid kinase family protein n=1 Tax=Robiginitalea sp. SC105 TaxID=2762332 RepID=UPI0021081112|nr:diacylglycerol kinase family protein [Robiginitalea sp. SC105]